MKFKLLHFFIVSSFFCHSIWASVNFSKIPSATNIEESKERFIDRKNTILEYWANKSIGQFGQNSNYIFAAVAKLLSNTGVDEVEKFIMSNHARPFSKFGTNYVLLKGLCQRKGDYDFTLQGLIRLAYTNLRVGGPLSSKAFNKLKHELLTAKGSTPYTHFNLGICGTFKDTENHILMTNTSMYLTNQLIYDDLENNIPEKYKYDNEINNFNNWMLRHLSSFLKNYFEEYNSRPYQGYTVLALNNLYSYAKSEKVKTATRAVLDLLSAVFAVQSNGLRRLASFSRQPKFDKITSVFPGDSEIARFTLLAGNYELLKNQFPAYGLSYGSHFALGAATSDYIVPDLILDLILNQKHKNYFQMIHHAGVEIYHSSENFLLSSGGKWVNKKDYGSMELDGRARPTAIIPSNDLSTDYRSWIRFAGHKKLFKRKNTCVYKNFACGLNFKLPITLPNGCIEIVGSWKFFNFNTTSCPLDYKFYVAAQIRKCSSLECKNAGDNFGFFEVRESKEINYSEFRNKIISNNKKIKLKFDTTVEYIDSLDNKIKFKIFENTLSRWEILSFNSNTFERFFEKWPLFKGDIINSTENGVVSIKNNFLKKELILNLNDYKNPKIQELEL